MQTQSFQSPFSHSGSIATSTFDLHVCLESTSMLGSSVGSEAAGASGGRRVVRSQDCASSVALGCTLQLLLAILSASEPGSDEDTEVPPVAMKLT